MAVDWQEPMVLQRKLRPSIARVNVQLDPPHAASKHTTAPINHITPSPVSFHQMAPPVRGNTHPITAQYIRYPLLSSSHGFVRYSFVSLLIQTIYDVACHHCVL